MVYLVQDICMHWEIPEWLPVEVDYYGAHYLLAIFTILLFSPLLLPTIWHWLQTLLENLGCHCPVWWLGHLAVVMNLSVIDSTFNSRADNGLASLQQWSVDGCGFTVSHIDLHFYWSGWDELACASVSSPGSFPTGIYLPQCVYVCLCVPSPWWPHVVLSSRDWCVHVSSTRALGVLIPEVACACSHSLFPVTFPCTSF